MSRKAGGRGWRLLAGIATLLLSAAAWSQQTSPPSAVPDPSDNSPWGSGPFAPDNRFPEDNPPSGDLKQNDKVEGAPNNSEEVSPKGSSTVLSANQIIAILHAKPEVMIDLKQFMSEYFMKQGAAIPDDSITDEMVLTSLATNRELRQSVSVWMRARGYATDADFDQSTEPPVQPESTQAQMLLRSQAAGWNAENGNSDALDQISRMTGDIPTDSTALASELSNSVTGELPNSRDATPGLRSSASQKQDRLPQQPEMQAPGAKQKLEPPRSDEVEVVHQPAPFNLQSLRDLYTQIPEQPVRVKRFGWDVFLTRGQATREMPIDLPIGPDYILGPGDGITISIWGGISQSFTRVVDREGKVVLPEAGPVVVAGLTLERAQTLVQGVLAPQFKDVKVAVSVAHLRTVRVYVVGDVQRPGAYDISSLSTPLNALYAAGGPTSSGSLRVVRHLRGETLIREVDLYDFLLHGVREDVERLEPGDTILVPAAGPQVEVSGMVKRPAIYELRDKEPQSEATLAAVLDDAGGVRAAAALSHIRVERIEADGHRSTLQVGLPTGSTFESARKQLDAFAVKDGDRVIVAPVLPYSERAIYLAGHVVRPGKVSYRDNMKLSDVLHSYQDLLPEPSDHGEIIRLMPPELRPEAIDFSVTDVLAGNGSIYLQPFDTIRIRGRYEADSPRVTVRGEVLQPGAYPLVQGMTAAQLVRIAGGFTRSALLDQADLASYEIEDGKQVVSRRSTVAIGLAVNGLEPNTDALLKPGDVLTVHQISGWNDIGASVKLAGEVTYPGTYGLQAGERLSSVIRRAGGFRSTAYPDGALLIRRQVQELEEKSRAELIRQIESVSAGARLGPSVSGGDDSATLQLLAQQQEQMLQRLRSQPVVGRLVIRISPDIASWVGTNADIELRSGDILTIPKRPGFILVSGQVYNATAITYVPGKDAEWYLRQAGGATELANRNEIFVIRANGLVVGRRSGEWYQEKVLSARLNPGDVVVVPQKIIGGSVFWRNMLATAQVFSSIALTGALALH
jgi:protein involved in polysaccharide export with SLBB domain